MNWLVYHIASGHSFFTGLALILFAVAIPYWRRPIARRLAGAAPKLDSSKAGDSLKRSPPCLRIAP